MKLKHKETRGMRRKKTNKKTRTWMWSLWAEEWFINKTFQRLMPSDTGVIFSVCAMTSWFRVQYIIVLLFLTEEEDSSILGVIFPELFNWARPEVSSPLQRMPLPVGERSVLHLQIKIIQLKENMQNNPMARDSPVVTMLLRKQELQLLVLLRRWDEVEPRVTGLTE